MKLVLKLGLIWQFCFLLLNAQDNLQLLNAQIGFFSSVGFGKNGNKDLRGGYTNFFGSIDLETKEFFGFKFDFGVSALGLVHKVKNQDMYSNIVSNDIGIGFRINNDEAKDFRYTSDAFLIHTLYVSYRNSWGAMNIGRFPFKLEWIGDYIQGIGVVIDRFEDWNIYAGWFNKQAYGDAQENVHFGYINHWYNEYEGYKIKNNYFLDVLYQNKFIDLNVYYNYFDTLLFVIGIKTDWDFTYQDWDFKTRFHYALVHSSVQSSQYCKNPDSAVLSGISCYASGTFGDVVGYLWQIEEGFHYRGWSLSLGYLQNDKGNATNNLPIYSDDNPLEYNTVIYGDGSKTSYLAFRYGHRSGYFLGFKYGWSYYGFGDSKSSQGQLNLSTGIEFGGANISLDYININDTGGYENNIAKIWLGFRF